MRRVARQQKRRSEPVIQLRQRDIHGRGNRCAAHPRLWTTPRERAEGVFLRTEQVGCPTCPGWPRSDLRVGTTNMLSAVRSDGEQPHNSGDRIASTHRHGAVAEPVFEPGNREITLYQQLGIEGAEVASGGAPSLDPRDADNGVFWNSTIEGHVSISLPISP